MKFVGFIEQRCHINGTCHIAQVWIHLIGTASLRTVRRPPQQVARRGRFRNRREREREEEKECERDERSDSGFRIGHEKRLGQNA